MHAKYVGTSGFCRQISGLSDDGPLTVGQNCRRYCGRRMGPSPPCSKVYGSSRSFLTIPSLRLLKCNISSLLLYDFWYGYCYYYALVTKFHGSLNILTYVFFPWHTSVNILYNTSSSQKVLAPLLFAFLCPEKQTSVNTACGALV